MKRVLIVLATAVAIAAPAAAITFPPVPGGKDVASGPATNILGQTGLLVTPTAETADPGQVAVTFHQVTDVANVAALNVGLVPGLEVSGFYYDTINSDVSGKFSGSVKYRLPVKPLGISLAGGWWDAGDRINSSPYGIASRRIANVNGFPLTVHVGWGSGIYNDKVFGGVEMPLAANLLAMAEFDGFFVNGGVRWYLPLGLRADVGYARNQLNLGGSLSARF